MRISLVDLRIIWDNEAIIGGKYISLKSDRKTVKQRDKIIWMLTSFGANIWKSII